MSDSVNSTGLFFGDKFPFLQSLETNLILDICLLIPKNIKYSLPCESSTE